jgi:hypothetical protein
MTPGQAVEQLAASAYERGVSPVAFTAAVIEVAAEETLGLDCHDPRVRILARRIVACILEAGWTSPAARQAP